MVEHASGQAAAANAGAKAAIAKEPVARIRKGEGVSGGLGKFTTLRWRRRSSSSSMPPESRVCRSLR
jgi:hypothetical protein